MRIKLILEYDGSEYFGWQIQIGQITVQEKLEQALGIFFKQPIRVVAAGRTDTGVHARNQVVHFDAPDVNVYRLKRALNGLLPDDIVVKQASVVDENFHARFSARARSYSYTIATNHTAINRKFVWTLFYPLNLTLMQRGAERISGFSDFQAFCKVKSEVRHYRCTVYESRWQAEAERLIFRITADRFLHGMVRALVGTLVELGRGKITLADLDQIYQKRDRTLVPLTAPASGLVLENVFYD
ncbi:MAG TPA: tRNA pseudouridine(38-40) synthase TruA [Caldithrix abyssi]|uniref:tRNA pseudouridine synthase A n=1 Tax=Caldithrix abyssi TaxID=187145 RepID=A0A7V5PS70_CALAY|nr:tRNA pseudouridine(38-40) synthase TruA [Caldithrix abyssi]